MKWLSGADLNGSANVGDRFDEAAWRVLKLPSPTGATARGRFARESTLSGPAECVPASSLPDTDQKRIERRAPTWPAIIGTTAETALDNLRDR